MSESALQRLQRRIGAMMQFAATGQQLGDQCTLALAGLARHRPFGGDSFYARLGRALTPDLPPRITAAGGQRIALDLSTLAEPMIFEEIFIDRTYPVEKVPFTPDVVIDCGAFCGMFTLLARAHFPTARFLAFEPEPHNFARLTGNLALNAAPVEAHAAAVGVTDGTVTFSGDGFGGHISAAGEPGGITVPLVSLAGLLRLLQPQRLVLKLDVEGAEREILPDILPLLPPQTVIFLETHHEEEVCRTYLQPCLEAGFNHELVRNRLPKDMPTLFLERMLIRNRAPVRYFCTYFDSHYSSMGLALYESLHQHCANFHLWVLCLDEECHQLLTRLALPGLFPVRLAEFEEGDSALLAAKANRSLLEYYFTCTPSLPLFLLHRHPEMELITYLDSDLFFYSDPEPMFSALGRNSIAIIAHRFADEISHFEENGIYNVGWLTFRRDAAGLACLQWWRERCLEWCYLRHEPGRYADQKYLDQWPQLFPGVVVIPHKGANLAMWNITNHQLQSRSRHMTVDHEPLIFFHFHGLLRQQPWLFTLSAGFYRARLTREMQWDIIIPYLAAVLKAERAYGIFCHPGRRFALEELSTRTTIPQKLRYAARIVINILRRNSVVVAFGRVFAVP